MQHPLAPLPKTPGVYALKNTYSGEIYIGQTVNLNRRHAEWRTAIGSGLGVKSSGLLAAFKQTGPEHWMFVVLALLPNATKEQLDETEQRAILRVQEKQPEKLLNSITTYPTNTTQAHHSGRTKITFNGKEISYQEMARLLGCKHDSVTHRAKILRRRGIFVIDAEQWLRNSKTYRNTKPTPPAEN